MTCILRSLVFLSAAVGLSAVPTGPDLPEIKPTSKTFALQGTARVEIKYKFTLMPDETQQATNALNCHNVCRGFKHFLHQGCDSSCDDSCIKIHQETFKPKIEGFDIASARQMEADAVQFKSDIPGQGYTLLMNEVRRLLDKTFSDKKYTVEYKSGCWNDKPCTQSSKAVRYRYYRVEADYTFFRMQPGAGGQQVRVEGPKGKSTGYILVPLGDPWPRQDKVVCSCELKSEAPQNAAGPTGNTGTSGSGAGGPGTDKPGVGTTPNPRGMEPGQGWDSSPFRVGFVGMSYQQGEPIDREFLQSVGFNVRCPNLSTALLTATNKTDKPIRFTICAGTVFVCIPGSGEGAQDTILVVDASFFLPPLSTQTMELKLHRPSGPFDLSQIGRLKTTDPNAPTQMPFEAAVLCLDIDKRAPTSSDVFDIAFPRNSSLVAIANKSIGQMIKGPWDQARMWIATDAASMEKVNSRLIPPVTEGEYVRSAYECAEWGGISFLNEPYRKCLDPKLALGLDAGSGAMTWFGRTMAAADPAGIAEFVRSNLDEIGGKYTSAQAAAHVNGVVGLSMGLISSGDKQCALAGLDLLLKGVPESARSRLAVHRGLGELASLLLSSNDHEVIGKALDVVQAIKPKPVLFACLNLQPSLPAELRARGKAIAGAP